ncbi:hypothetical protein D3C77_761570 [compost metagenome]
MFAASVPWGLGGISKTLSQNTDSLSDANAAPVNITRRLWPLPGSMRATGGDSTNGALELVGVDSVLPVSIHD